MEQVKVELGGALLPENYVTDLYRKLILSVKASNSIPSEEEDYFYHVKYDPQFQQQVDQTQQHVQSVLEKLLQQEEKNSEQNEQAIKQNMAEKSFNCDLTDVHTTSQINDCVDNLLEQAAQNLQRFLQGDKNPTVAVADHKNKKPMEMAKKNTNQMMLTKPQLSFVDKVDNSEAPFVCKLVEKPNASNEGMVMEDEEVDGKYHPYAMEIKSIKYPVWQINDPHMEENQIIPIEDVQCTWVDTKEKLDVMLKVLQQQQNKYIAIDLEHHSHRTFLGILCLMQISIENEDWLVDTIALRSELHVLNHVFTDPNKLKILHGANMDILWLQRDLGLYIVNMFDTGQAARILHYSRFSLAYALQKHCKINAEKQYQLADWRIRPLSKEMIKYAREDTRFLIYIYHEMRKELKKQSGNSSSSMLRTVFQNSNEICLQVYEKPIWTSENSLELANRLKNTVNINVLTDIQSKIFLTIHRWRDIKAREYDESPGYVLPNHLLIKITKFMPTTSGQLFKYCNPLPPLVRKFAHDIALSVTNVKKEHESTKSKSNEAAESASSERNMDKIAIAPLLETVHDLCDFAGWKSVSDEKRKSIRIADNTLKSPLGLMLSLPDQSQINTSSSKAIILDEIRKNLSHTEFYLVGKDTCAGNDTPNTVTNRCLEKNAINEVQKKEKEVIVQSISETYSLSRKSRKRKIDEQKKQNQINSLSSNEDAATVPSDVMHQRKMSIKAESTVISSFDYEAAGKKIKINDETDRRTELHAQNSSVNQVSTSYNPFVTMNRNSVHDAKTKKNSSLPSSIKYNAPRSSTFK